MALACRAVLATPGPADKALRLGVVMGNDASSFEVRDVELLDAGPDFVAPGVLDYPPSRPTEPELVSGPLTRAKLPLSHYLLHALAHIELNAVDIYSHTVAAWAPGGPLHDGDALAVPLDCWADLTRVAQDEARHFLLLEARMKAVGFRYGGMPAHKALWSHASSTSRDLLARLAIIPMVQEAHALDSGPRLEERLRSANDHASADVVALIVREEVGHVATGLRAFKAVAEARGLDPVDAFHATVREHVPRLLPGPFNDALRELTGMGREYYEPLRSPPRRPRRGKGEPAASG